MKRTACVTVRSCKTGTRLFDLITERFTYHSEQKWNELIASGHILLNEQTACGEETVHDGDVIEYLIPEHEEPEVDSAYSIVYEDESVLAVSKPGNLPCHPGGKFFNHTLWRLLLDRGLQKVEFINRLDRETSGIVLVAKTPAAARFCRRQFEKRLVEKKYLVAIEGEFPDFLEADGEIFPDPTSSIRKKQAFSNEKSGNGQEAVTVFRRLHAEDGMSLVEAELKSGRFHQIRATLCSLGFPVVGDKLYGVDDTIFLRFINGEMTTEDNRQLRISRQALHAYKLSLSHPNGSENLNLHAPVPSCLKNLFPMFQGLGKVK